MRKYLLLALATAAILATQLYYLTRQRIVHADVVEAIRVDAVAQTMNVTVTAANGSRATIVFTPGAAVQAQQEMARMVLLSVESAEALRAQQATNDQTSPGAL